MALALGIRSIHDAKVDLVHQDSRLERVYGILRIELVARPGGAAPRTRATGARPGGLLASPPCPEEGSHVAVVRGRPHMAAVYGEATS